MSIEEKKRIVSYVPVELLAHVEDLAEEMNISKSMAIGVVLAKHFGVDIMPFMPERIVSVEVVGDLEQRVARLEEQMNAKQS